MTPFVTYCISILAGSAGIALIFFLGGFGRAVGVVLLLGAALGALAVRSRPTEERLSPHALRD